MKNFLPIGVCDLKQLAANVPHCTSDNDYIHEVLGHAGLAYAQLTQAGIAEWASGGGRVLVTVGEAEFPADLVAHIEAWVDAGGAWLSIGGLCGAGHLFGVELEWAPYLNSYYKPTVHPLGEGYLVPSAHRLFEHLEIPLHFFNGIAVTAGSEATVLAGALDPHGRPRHEPLIIERGNCLLIAADVVGTVVHVQQGRAVTRDGIPCPDGSGPVSDGVLKSDDGMAVDWYFDRQEIEGANGLKGFLQPIGDCWREIVLRAILILAEKTKAPVALLWFYPRNQTAIAHMSHDSDMNAPVYAWQLLRFLDEMEIKSTWCIIEPGYEPAIIQTIVSSGHELAMHYDALDRPWGYDEFARQWEFLVKQFGSRPVANKNHYTRWEGDCEFYHWCVHHDIQLDQSKGVSKVGSVGFNFGTCHTYFPQDPSGETIDVVVMTTICQDLAAFAPAAVGPPLLAASLKHYGLFHMLFHPNNTHRADVEAALKDVVKLAKDAGLEWWTAGQINTWERARRKLVWSVAEGSGISWRAGAGLPGATLLFANTGDAKLNGNNIGAAKINRWGFDFDVVQTDLAEGTVHVLQ